MDDMFFSDKDEKNKSNNRPKRPNDFIYEDFQNEYSNAPEEKKFVVNIPDDEYTPADRRPKGRPVSDNDMFSETYRYPQDKPYVPDSESGSRNVYSGRPRPSTPQQNPVRRQAPNGSRQPQGTRQNPRTNRPQGRRPQGDRPVQPIRRKKKTNIKLKAIIAIVCVIVIAFLSVFAYGWSLLGKLTYDKDFEDENAYMDESDLTTSKSVKNILFLGSDARGDVQGQRSDTMILFSIDKKHHKVKMTSFLRDSYVYIPSEGYKTKLNAAFAYGGPQLLIDTIEYNFGVKIDDYVLIDFEGFTKLIDLMGGLDIDGVTEAEAKYMRDVVKVIYIKEGKNHMSGAASLWYCRIRYLDNDFKRTERQRKVISAIITQMMHTSPVKLAKAVGEVMPMVTTSMDKNSLIPVVVSALTNYIGSDNPQHQIPAEDTWSNQMISGQAVLAMDIEENQKLLEDFLYGNSKKK